MDLRCAHNGTPDAMTPVIMIHVIIDVHAVVAETEVVALKGKAAKLKINLDRSQEGVGRRRRRRRRTTTTRQE
jgi:hypothetical protein